MAVVGGCYDGHWALWVLDRRKRLVGHTMYSPVLQMPSLQSGRCVVFESPVRSGYWVPRGSNRDQDWLGFVPEPKIT